MGPQAAEEFKKKQQMKQLPVLEDEPLAKKLKVSEQQPVVQIIGNEEVMIIKDDTKKKVAPGKEAAIEAEARAARERAVVPLETRMKQFKDLLEEKQISAYSTWEKELHKIVFDPRYLLLTSKERKQVFDKYVRERAEEEREKKRKQKQRRRKMVSGLYVKKRMSLQKQAGANFPEKCPKMKDSKQLIRAGTGRVCSMSISLK